MLPWFQNNKFPLYLAPMAGFTDVVYRQLCKQEGADVLVTEFVMSDSILRGDPFVWQTLDFSEQQRPIGIQIFGYDPASMAEAAKRIVDRCDPDFIDINFGCPSKKVTCQEAGASLLKVPDKLVHIAETVVKALPNKPVTAKIRLGWDASQIVAPALAPRLQDAGIQALAIHGRTKEQGYGGTADWNTIYEIAESVNMPIIGNGNIRNSEQVYHAMTQSKVRGVMIGRGAQGYPWIFREIKAHLETGKTPPPPTLQERWDTILRYAELLAYHPINLKPDKSIAWMRSRLVKLTKDMHGCKKIRHELTRIERVEDIRPIAEKHIERYAKADAAVQKRLSS